MTSDSTQNQTTPPSILQEPELQDKVALLKAKISSSIEHTRQKRKHFQKCASYIRVTSIVLSGIATLVLGLQITGFERYVKDTAFILVSLVTLTNALEPFFNFRALWVEHEAAIAEFHRLEDDLEFYLAGTPANKLSTEQLEGYHKEYTAIWEKLSNSWIEHRKSGKSSS